MSQDQDENDRRRTIFSSVFFFRMLAILLFVALGTFAVFQSLQPDKNSNAVALNEDDPNNPPIDNESEIASKNSAADNVPTVALAGNTVESKSDTSPSPHQSTTPFGTAPAPGPLLPSKSALAASDLKQSSEMPEVKSFSFTTPVEPPKTPESNPAPRSTPAQAFAANQPDAKSPAGLPNLNRPADRPGMLDARPVSNSNAQSLANPASSQVAPLGNQLNQTSPKNIDAEFQEKLAESAVPLPNSTAAQQMQALIDGGKAQPAQPASELVDQSSTALNNLADAAKGMLASPANPNSNSAEMVQPKQVPFKPISLPETSPGATNIPTNPTGSPANSPTQQGGGASQFAAPGNAANSPRQFPGQAAPEPETSTNPNQPNGQFAVGANRALPGAQPSSNNYSNSPPATPASTSGPYVPAMPARTVVPGTTNANTLATPGETSLEGVQTPSIAIEKIAPREIQIHQPANFAIVVRNVGRVPASDVRIFDRIPAGTSLIKATPQPEPGGGDNLVWLLGDLPPGQERKIELELRPERPGEIGSVAQFTFASQASARTRVTQPVLSIEHTAPPQVMMGSPVSLNITVRNNGDGPATNVIVQEKVPEQLRYNEGIRDLEYEIGTLAPGQSKSLTLTLQTAAVGQFRNLVGAVGDGGLNANHETTIQVISPNLVASSDGPHRRFLKRETSHSFSVQNTGTASATNIDLIAQLPRAIRFVSANNQGQYDPGSHAVYWSLADLRATQTATVTLETQPVETGNVKIDFIARAELNQRAETAHELTIEHLVDIYFELDDVVDHIETGAATEYRVRIVNQGTKPAEDIRLVAEFEAGIRPESVTGGLRGVAEGQKVTFEPIPGINPGAEIIALISATGVASGEHRVAVNLQTGGREINITKEESTRVYADR